jgi:hypothetical protein
MPTTDDGRRTTEHGTNNKQKQRPTCNLQLITYISFNSLLITHYYNP